MRKLVIRAILCSASLIGLSSVAHAQQSDAPDAHTGGVDVIDEIVVTAQKRSENLQDVPISISVVTGEDLQKSGATQLADYAANVPGLHITSGGNPGQAIVSLRGISPLGSNATISTYLDEAPMGSSSLYARSSSFALDLLPYDVQQIEVLRGPQGTLYGASSIGGLIKYVTVDPRLNGFSGKLGGEAFTIDHASNKGFAVQGAINAAIVEDKVGVTASFAHRDTPGFIDNVRSGERDINDYTQSGARVALLAQPSEALTIRLSGLWQKVNSDGNAAQLEDVLTGELLGGGYSTNNFLAEPFKKSIYLASGIVDYDLGGVTLTSATSYSKVKTHQEADFSVAFGSLFPLFGFPAGLSGFANDLDLSKFTQEFRVSSKSGGNFEWLIGGFYTNENSKNFQKLSAEDLNGNLIAGFDPIADLALLSRYREYALFANTTYRFSDMFHLTGGLRWAHNAQTFRDMVIRSVVAPSSDDTGESSEGVFTYSISPQLHLGKNTMIYARVATGYRPGGPNISGPGIPPTVGADRLVNYELGIKAQTDDRSLSIDAALYRMDWKDIQLAVQFGNFTGAGNAGRARAQGFEASVIARPTAGLKFGANFNYTESKLTEDAPPSVGGLKGDPLPGVPELTVSVSADYDFAIGDTVRAFLGAQLRHQSKTHATVASRPDDLIAKGYETIDVNAGLEFDDRWSLRAYIRNLNNSRGVFFRSLESDGFGVPARISSVSLQPRTAGLSLEFSF